MLFSLLGGGSFSEIIISLLLSLPAIIIAFSIHEMSHALVGYKLGDPTAKNMGRISLNPFRHIDIIGFGSLLLFGFGWAKAVPFNPNYLKNPKIDSACIALAGPLSNLILAFVAMNLYVPLQNVEAAWAYYVSFFLYILIIVNIGLGIFNLIPISPLDGSKVLYAFLPERAYYKMLEVEKYGMYILIGLILIGNIAPQYDVFNFLYAAREGIFDGFYKLVSLYIH